MICTEMFLFLVTILEVKGDCLASNCQMISLDVYQDAVQFNSVLHEVHAGLSLFVSQLQGNQRPNILRVERRKSLY